MARREPIVELVSQCGGEIIDLRIRFYKVGDLWSLLIHDLDGLEGPSFREIADKTVIWETHKELALVLNFKKLARGSSASLDTSFEKQISVFAEQKFQRRIKGPRVITRIIEISFPSGIGGNRTVTDLAVFADSAGRIDLRFVIAPAAQSKFVGVLLFRLRLLGHDIDHATSLASTRGRGSQTFDHFHPSHVTQISPITAGFTNTETKIIPERAESIDETNRKLIRSTTTRINSG